MTPPPRRATAQAAHTVPRLTFDESLPVCGRRDEIAAAMTSHQVVIVCGETGSGKTTQLPKIALTIGRGMAVGGRGLIGHTQPRRIAASSVARRIAQELDSPLGEVVGFKIRFQDRLSPGTSIKLMTDGILLAETQSDPLLRAYDTLIIDEAHERSLNVDFLLGYLRQLLPRRPDLKVVVTSATIDADRFARHFATADGPAPVIQVSGRLFPVEQRWRPYEESRDYGLPDAVRDAVDELWPTGSASGGDVLVFLPGEREIRDVADHLRRHHPPGTEVVPLFARLSQQEQDRVFEPHAARRIVLATNVAETSLTVPGIRYVIDAGTARVKRYSYRQKVEQLQVEPISQAAANQRSGRCGRVSDGVCIRLYDERDFASRPRFSDPEILRSSLAGVILRMKSLRLGSIEEFPFIDAPSGRAIADGYQLLAELGAVDDRNELTPIGEELARLPLDPRVGRMILEARQREALTEVLILASAMSVQDVRDRPLEAQQAADAAHRPFDDERSEFVGDLKLWRWLETTRGGGEQHKLSARKQEQLLRDHFISPRRVREWRDIHSQLLTVVTEHGWRMNASAATYEQLHLSLLSGLLGNVGLKNDEAEWYLGARGIRFYRHPGVRLLKKPGRWIMASELVETTRLYGRGIAAIEPQWLPVVGGHLIKTQLLEPHWERHAAEVVALERATLYGLVVYSNKRVNYGLVNPAEAREIFIREALVAGQWESKAPFFVANRRLVVQIEELEHKSRRQDVLVDDGLIFAFYDHHLPPDVCSGVSLERWYRDAVRRDPQVLRLTRDELMRHEAAGVTTQAFPRLLRLGGVDCSAEYLHQPGDSRDGVTVSVPIFALNQIDEEVCEWLVPGLIKDKVLALLKTLPQRPRSRLVPLPERAAAFTAHVEIDGAFAKGGLLDLLLLQVREATGLDVKRADFKREQVPDHLFMNFRVVDEHGRQLGMGRNLASLKAQWGGQARSAFQALARLQLATRQPPSDAGAAIPSARAAVAGAIRQGAGNATSPSSSASPAATATATASAETLHTDWTFAELPELLELRRGGVSVVGYPALVDRGTGVAIDVFDELPVAQARHREGLRRLVSLQIRDALKYLEKNLPELQKSSVLYMPLGTSDELRLQIIDLAIERAFLAEPLPDSATSFGERLEAGRGRLNLIANELARTAHAILVEHAAAMRKLKDSRAPKELADDISSQLGRLVTKNFLRETPAAQMPHLIRYLKGIVMRLDKWRADPARDAARLAELRPIEQRFLRSVVERKGVRDPRLDEFRWLIEELRVSLFAQELRTPQPVSSKRLDKVWAQLGR